MKHLLAILALPGSVLGAIPALILLAGGGARPAGLATVGPGVALMLAGLALMAWTIALFARRGRGTLAPWNPPDRLVVAGPYRHVRNPMLTGVFLVLLGEALLFRSPWIGAWFAVFVLAAVVYMPLVEEPVLLRRFGGEYERYRAVVPRWIPRLRPWRA